MLFVGGGVRVWRDSGCSGASHAASDSVCEFDETPWFAVIAGGGCLVASVILVIVLVVVGGVGEFGLVGFSAYGATLGELGVEAVLGDGGGLADTPAADTVVAGRGEAAAAVAAAKVAARHVAAVGGGGVGLTEAAAVAQGAIVSQHDTGRCQGPVDGSFVLLQKLLLLLLVMLFFLLLSHGGVQAVLAGAGLHLGQEQVVVVEQSVAILDNSNGDDPLIENHLILGADVPNIFRILLLNTRWFQREAKICWGLVLFLPSDAVEHVKGGEVGRHAHEIFLHVGRPPTPGGVIQASLLQDEIELLPRLLPLGLDPQGSFDLEGGRVLAADIIVEDLLEEGLAGVLIQLRDAVGPAGRGGVLGVGHCAQEVLLGAAEEVIALGPWDEEKLVLGVGLPRAEDF